MQAHEVTGFDVDSEKINRTLLPMQEVFLETGKGIKQRLHNNHFNVA